MMHIIYNNYPYKEYMIHFFQKNYAVQLSRALRAIRPPTDTHVMYIIYVIGTAHILYIQIPNDINVMCAVRSI